MNLDHEQQIRWDLEREKRNKYFEDTRQYVEFLEEFMIKQLASLRQDLDYKTDK